MVRQIDLKALDSSESSLGEESASRLMVQASTAIGNAPAHEAWARWARGMPFVGIASPITNALRESEFSSYARARRSA